jgi:hypothetical protein
MKALKTSRSIANRFFGIELEGFHHSGRFTDQVTIQNELSTSGADVRAAGYTHLTTPYWKIVTDGSVDGAEGGFELVSPKLIGEDGLKQVAAVVSAAGAHGYRVDRRCGFHVHVDCSDLTLEQLKRVALMFVKFEQVFDVLVPQSRRGTNNGYCRSIKSRWANIEDAFAAIKKATTIRDLIGVVNAHDRYYKLNLTNLQGFNSRMTIEFRQAAGTWNAEKAINWIRVCVAFVEEARNQKTVRKPEYLHRSMTDQVRSLIDGEAFKGQGLRRYFYARARELDARRGTATNP